MTANHQDDFTRDEHGQPQPKDRKQAQTIGNPVNAPRDDQQNQDPRRRSGPGKEQQERQS
jgi:hypothetical protein